MSESFNAVVGAKRQLTIPAGLFRQMSLKEGDQIRLTVEGNAVVLEPMVSIPRHMVSETLLQEMEARRGGKESDISLSEFRARRQEQEQAHEQQAEGAEGAERLSSLNVRGVLPAWGRRRRSSAADSSALARGAETRPTKVSEQKSPRRVTE